MKIYLCINLEDFHTNQKDGKTITEIKFLSAKDQNHAEALIHSLHPDIPFFVIPKGYCDKRIVTRN